MLIITAIALFIGLAAADVRGCGNGGATTGTYTSADVQANLGDVQLQPFTSQIFREGTAQICVVNNAPNTVVVARAGDLNSEINQIQNQCCGTTAQCVGGAGTFVANANMNQIDVSIQVVGSNCQAQSS